MFPIFVIKFSGVSDLQGVKVPDFPLTLLVIVTTVLRYRAACDNAVVWCHESNHVILGSVLLQLQWTSTSEVYYPNCRQTSLVNRYDGHLAHVTVDLAEQLNDECLMITPDTPSEELIGRINLSSFVHYHAWWQYTIVPRQIDWCSRSNIHFIAFASVVQSFQWWFITLYASMTSVYMY